jgi:glycosyltransferase involved in cell wall biosynthesis
VPVYNEADLVREGICGMGAALERLGASFEIIVCENGSIDRTVEVVSVLAADSRIRVEQLSEPNYGLVLKHGILATRHETVVIFKVDFWSEAFIVRALEVLNDADLVVGSKALPTSTDARPRLRRLITRAFNGAPHRARARTPQTPAGRQRSTPRLHRQMIGS